MTDCKKLVAQAHGALDRNDLLTAKSLCMRLQSQFPHSAEAISMMGDYQMKMGAFPVAAQNFRQAISLKPKQLALRIRLVEALQANEDHIEALDVLESATRMLPTDLSLRLRLAHAYFESGLSRQALEQMKFVESKSNLDLPSLSLIAKILFTLNRLEETKDYLKCAIALGDVESRIMLGYLHQARGEFEEAAAQFGEAIQQDPTAAAAYHGYAQGRKLSEKDRPFLDCVLSLIDSGSLDQENEMILEYVAGKGLEDLGEYSSSFAHFKSANCIAFIRNLGGRAFNKQSHAKFLRETESHFPADLLSHARKPDRKIDVTPIFVVGVMRSGTSLVEQILSTHPDIVGGGELDFWPDHHRDSFDLAVIPDLRSAYLFAIETNSYGAPWLIDKMPQNYQTLGPIHMAFPEAPIIHVRRSPIDTCFSIYTTAYSMTPEFAHNLESIRFMYEQYVAIMDYWRTALPSGRLIEIDYEDLIADREAVLRSVLQRIGTDWDDSVLHHESNPRTVITPSVWQVRQPLYSGSVGRWKNFEPWLGPLKPLLS